MPRGRRVTRLRIKFILVFLFFLPLFFVYSAEPLKINLFSFRNGVGLQTEQKVMQEALELLGHSVVCINYGDKGRKRKADINIFFEHPLPEKYSWATLNWFIPDPEWYTRDIKLLDKMDLILCKTKESLRIFSDLHYPTYYLGFTSPDCYRSEIKKDFSRFFHLAGGSDQKGTGAILKIWMANPYYSHLTLIKHSSEWIISQRNLKFISTYLPESELRQLQNQCGIHLCPSETEGFGHYIMEAMSTGAVVVTTDAPPMNEFIQDRRCLVPYMKTAEQRLGINYYVNPVELKKKIESLASLTPEELRAIGENNRLLYLRKKREFYERLNKLLNMTAAGQRP